MNALEEARAVAGAGFASFQPTERYAGRMATISIVSGSMIKS
jgi:hypothetical protein